MQVIQGKNELYVVPKQLTRRKVLKKTIKLASNKEPLDFLLYIADDPYNEKVFSYMNTLQQSELAKKLDPNIKIYSCTIGRRVTEAHYFLNSIDSVLKLLTKLPQVSPQPQQIKPVIARKAKSLSNFQGGF